MCFSPDFLPLGLLLLQPLELFLLLGPLFPPLVDVLLELLVKLALLGLLAGLEEVSISPRVTNTSVIYGYSLDCDDVILCQQHQTRS